MTDYRLELVADVLDPTPELGVLHADPRSAALLCPCGCGDWLMLPLQPGDKPSWTLSGTAEAPTLWPSIHLGQGCCSHFWITDGQLIWC